MRAFSPMGSSFLPGVRTLSRVGGIFGHLVSRFLIKTRTVSGFVCTFSRVEWLREHVEWLREDVEWLCEHVECFVGVGRGFGSRFVRSRAGGVARELLR